MSPSTTASTLLTITSHTSSIVPETIIGAVSNAAPSSGEVMVTSVGTVSKVISTVTEPLSWPNIFLEVKISTLSPSSPSSKEGTTHVVSLFIGTYSVPLIRTDAFISFVPSIVMNCLFVYEGNGITVGAKGGNIGESCAPISPPSSAWPLQGELGSKVKS